MVGPKPPRWQQTPPHPPPPAHHQVVSAQGGVAGLLVQGAITTRSALPAPPKSVSLPSQKLQRLPSPSPPGGTGAPVWPYQGCSAHLGPGPGGLGDGSRCRFGEGKETLLGGTGNALRVVVAPCTNRPAPPPCAHTTWWWAGGAWGGCLLPPWGLGAHHLHPQMPLQSVGGPKLFMRPG